MRIVDTSAAAGDLESGVRDPGRNPAPAWLALVLAPLLAASLQAQVGGTPQEPGTAGTERERRLQSEIDELRQRVDQLEQGSTTTGDHPKSTLPQSPTSVPEGFWSVSGTNLALKIGGYVKLDVIHDFDAIGNRNKFATQSIAVPEESASRTTFNPYETRLNFDLRGPVGDHDGRVFVEGDFYGGGGGTFQLRHAFFQVGRFLAGQTWTTYMDLSSRPLTLDFEGPDAELFIRQPMVRWTQPFREGDKSTFSIALEGSSQDLTISAPAMGEATTPLPDLTGNVRLEGDGRHVQLSGVARYLDFDADAGGGSDESAFGWGVALSGKTELGAHGRRLMGQVSYGEGSARYNQALRGTGSDAVLDSAGDLEPLPLWTAVVGYEHEWSDKWMSTLAYSIAVVDTDAAQAPTAMEQGQSGSINLIWHPYDAVHAGVEYLVGQRENADGQDGVAHRVQMSFKFAF